MRKISSVLTSRMFHKLSHVPRNSIQQGAQICINIFHTIINNVASQTIVQNHVFWGLQKNNGIKRRCFQGFSEGKENQTAAFHTCRDLITPVTDKEGSAQICREKKSVKKSTQGGGQCTWNLRHCTAGAGQKDIVQPQAGQKEVKPVPVRVPPHLTDKFAASLFGNLPFWLLHKT